MCGGPFRTQPLNNPVNHLAEGMSRRAQLELEKEEYRPRIVINECIVDNPDDAAA
jgi:hypothetical protein